VVVTTDGGHTCYDTTVSARDIARQLQPGGALRYDPENQRGVKPGSKKFVVREAKVKKWADQLLDGSAIFGQLTWNFRPEEASSIRFEPNGSDRTGTLIVEDAVGTIPDSWHRHMAIQRAVESAGKGSGYDPGQRFSLRIWSVPSDFERAIFYAMNQEGDKADSTRSKWLFQDKPGQKIAAGLVHRSPHLGSANVETISNTVSKKSHRLAAFNTFAAACEEVWKDDEMSADAIGDLTDWLVNFWDELVKVIPELGLLDLRERQAARESGSLAASAMGIHGYLRLAHKLYPDGDLSMLAKLPGTTADGLHDYLDIANPLFASRGIVVPGSGRNSSRLIVRSSHASRRSMGEVLAERIGLE
jgi:hypothetical protein